MWGLGEGTPSPSFSLRVWPVGALLSLRLMLMVSVDIIATFTSDQDQQLMVLLLLRSYCGSSFHTAPYGSCLRVGHDSVILFAALTFLVRPHKTPTICRSLPDVLFVCFFAVICLFQPALNSALRFKTVNLQCKSVSDFKMNHTVSYFSFVPERSDFVQLPCTVKCVPWHCLVLLKVRSIQSVKTRREIRLSGLCPLSCF